MSFKNDINAQWERLAPRERQLTGLAASLLTLAVAWWLLIAPAVHTWRTASGAHAQLQAQLAQMQALALETKALKAAPKQTATQVHSWLEGSIKKLGKATLTLQGSQAKISFTGASAESLADYLAQARTNAALLPVQANWKRTVVAKSDAKGDAKAEDTALWDGSLVFEVAP